MWHADCYRRTLWCTGQPSQPKTCCPCCQTTCPSAASSCNIRPFLEKEATRNPGVQLFGFCDEHGNAVRVQSEADLEAVKERLVAGEIHRSTVVTMMKLVPMHAVYYTGFPLRVYGSCNRFDKYHMHQLFIDIVEVWEGSPALCQRGHIIAIGTDGDARRSAAGLMA